MFNLSDEKWFYGLVARTFAKACESLGIKKQSFSCQHKSHITKVMGHGTVGYCFDSDPELGGTGYLIGLHRCQSYKVMQRKVNEQTIDAETGKRKQKGNPLKYNRGDLVLTDCNVTGSNYGTASQPKFPLMELWKTVLLPELDLLVKPGGPCEGAVVVHQEDNAGPHIDKTYKDWLQAEFNNRGWKLEHQAPQGPYTNVLDLQMFPAMSKRHSEVLQMYSNNEANAEKIWRVACQVWKSCSSSMVSKAFIHAYRIMQKIIENDGHNHWLVDGTPHCNVRRDFIDTKHGIAPRPIINIDVDM